MSMAVRFPIELASLNGNVACDSGQHLPEYVPRVPLYYYLLALPWIRPSGHALLPTLQAMRPRGNRQDDCPGVHECYLRVLQSPQ